VNSEQQVPLFEEIGDPQARRVLDWYPTPAWMTLALLRREPVRGPVLEAAVGDGAIRRVLESQGLTVVGNDVDESRAAEYHEDITRPEAWERFGLTCPWAGTNLPFNVADEVVPLAVDWLYRHKGPGPFGVAFLLRLSWLEPTEARGIWLKAHPPHRVIVLPRHDFRGNGQTDSVTSAWFVWRPDVFAPWGVEVVTKDERDELIAESAKASAEPEAADVCR